MSFLRTCALAALLAAATTAPVACNTPSIPIPPPEPGAMSFDIDQAAGTATYSYAADPDFGGAIVYVFDRDSGVGVIDTARADGSVGPTRPFQAAVGDHVVVTYETDDQLASTCVVLAAGTPTVTCTP